MTTTIAPRCRGERRPAPLSLSLPLAAPGMAGKLVQIFEPINLGFNHRKLPSLLSKKPTNHLPPLFANCLHLPPLPQFFFLSVSLVRPRVSYRVPRPRTIHKGAKERGEKRDGKMIGPPPRAAVFDAIFQSGALHEWSIAVDGPFADNVRQRGWSCESLNRGELYARKTTD